MNTDTSFNLYTVLTWFTLAPCSTRSLQISMFRKVAANISGVQPLPFVIFTLHFSER